MGDLCGKGVCLTCAHDLGASDGWATGTLLFRSSVERLAYVCNAASTHLGHHGVPLSPACASGGTETSTNELCV
eukprot:525121-Amphidinium_carterae.2